ALREIDEHLLDEVHLLELAARLGARAPAREERREEALRRETRRLVLRGELVPRRVGRLADATRLRDEALRDATDFLRLRFGRLDALVQHEVGREVTEHRAAATGVAVELSTRVVVSHLSSALAAPSSARASGANCRSSCRAGAPCWQGFP